MASRIGRGFPRVFLYSDSSLDCSVSDTKLQPRATCLKKMLRQKATPGFFFFLSLSVLLRRPTHRATMFESSNVGGSIRQSMRRPTHRSTCGTDSPAKVHTAVALTQISAYILRIKIKLYAKCDAYSVRKKRDSVSTHLKKKNMTQMITEHIRECVEGKRASCEEHFIALNRLMNLVAKVLWNATLVCLFLFLGTHFRIFVRMFLAHLRTVYASPRKLARQLYDSVQSCELCAPGTPLRELTLCLSFSSFCTGVVSSPLSLTTRTQGTPLTANSTENCHFLPVLFSVYAIAITMETQQGIFFSCSTVSTCWKRPQKKIRDATSVKRPTTIQSAIRRITAWLCYYSRSEQNTKRLVFWNIRSAISCSNAFPSFLRALLSCASRQCSGAR